MAYKGQDPAHDKAADDEPIFTLRAQDKIAPAIVGMWGTMAQLLGAPEPKVREAFECVRKMVEWQTENPDKVKVPD